MSEPVSGGRIRAGPISIRKRTDDAPGPRSGGIPGGGAVSGLDTGGRLSV